MNKFKNHNVCGDHTVNCPAHEDCDNVSYYRGVETVLIYRDNDFHILTYCQCLRGYVNKYDFISNLLKPNNTNKHKYREYEVTSSWLCDHKLRKKIKEGNVFNAKILESNYLYMNAAGKKYSICSEIYFMDAFVSNAKLIELNYKKAMEYIMDNELEWLEDNLKRLYELNKPVIWSGIKKQTITEFNNFFRKQIKTKKDETSKY
jgi:hypothetical protein